LCEFEHELFCTNKNVLPLKHNIVGEHDHELLHKEFMLSFICIKLEKCKTKAFSIGVLDCNCGDN